MRSLSRVFVFSFAAALLTWAGGANFVRGQEAKKGVSLTLNGQIVEGDAKDAVRQMPCKIHIVKLEKGKKYQIDMTSTDFDTYLRVESSTGEDLAQDDDGGGNLNARIRFTPTKDDSFKIIATSFSGGEGNYTLTVRDLDGPAPAGKGGKGGTKDADEKGVIKLDTPTKDKATTVDGALNDQDPPEPIGGKTAKTYSVELKDGMAYAILMNSGDFDSFLRVLDANGKELASDDDSGGDLNSKILFVPPATGRYRVLATTFDGGLGNFSLSIQSSSEYGKAVKADPKKIHTYAEPFFVTGRFAINDPKDTVQQNSPSHVHQVKLEKGKTYVIDLIGGQMDAYLRIEDADKKGLAEDDDGGEGLNSRLEFRPEETGTYRLIATNLDGGLGSYLLAIREQK